MTETGTSRRDAQDRLRLEAGEPVSGRELLIATGRAPRVAELGLETLGVEIDSEGLSVDERCRVIDGVRAVGDVAAHVELAYREGFEQL